MEYTKEIRAILVERIRSRLDNLEYEPTQDGLDIEFEAYSIELAEEKEIARKKDMRDRFKALPDLRACMVKASNHTPNSKKMIKKAIKNNDIELLESLEAAANEVSLEIQTRDRKELEKEARLKKFKKTGKATLKELTAIVHDML